MGDYLQHARRHLPTGSDPIPGSVGSSAWAILSGTECVVSGSPSTTITAGTAGICIWDSFVASGDLDVFATHNTVAYPGYSGVVVPAATSFNNSSGDTWIFAVKTGIILGWFDVGFTGSTFPFQVTRNPGNSSYQGGEPYGPQDWYTSSPPGNIFSWSWIRPIDNDPSNFYDIPGDDFYYEFDIELRNNDVVDHTIDSGINFQLTLAWVPVTPLATNFVY